MAITVLITVAASLVLLPALLALCGQRIQRHVGKQAAEAAEKGRAEGSRWRAMAGLVQGRPLTTLLVGAIALLALSGTALSMRLGFADSGNDPGPPPHARPTTCSPTASVPVSTVPCLDAVVIRCLIVPAGMQMLGRWASWLPAPLARRLPRLSIERPDQPALRKAARPHTTGR